MSLYADISKPPAPLPSPRPQVILPGVTLLPPLSRRGHGPGLILLVPDSNAQLTITDGVPSVLIKWAEEGYTIVAISASAIESPPVDLQQLLAIGTKALKDSIECNPKDEIGLVCK